MTSVIYWVIILETTPRLYNI